MRRQGRNRRQVLLPDKGMGAGTTTFMSVPQVTEQQRSAATHFGWASRIHSPSFDPLSVSQDSYPLTPARNAALAEVTGSCLAIYFGAHGVVVGSPESDRR